MNVLLKLALAASFALTVTACKTTTPDETATKSSRPSTQADGVQKISDQQLSFVIEQSKRTATYLEKLRTNDPQTFRLIQAIFAAEIARIRLVQTSDDYMRTHEPKLYQVNQGLTTGVVAVTGWSLMIFAQGAAADSLWAPTTLAELLSPAALAGGVIAGELMYIYIKTDEMKALWNAAINMDDALSAMENRQNNVRFEYKNYAEKGNKLSTLLTAMTNIVTISGQPVPGNSIFFGTYMRAFNDSNPNATNQEQQQRIDFLNGQSVLN